MRAPSSRSARLEYGCLLFKNLSLTERLKLRITADFFNFFNHPNDVNPNSTTGLQDLSTKPTSRASSSSRRESNGRKLSAISFQLSAVSRPVGLTVTLRASRISVPGKSLHRPGVNILNHMDCTGFCCRAGSPMRRQPLFSLLCGSFSFCFFLHGPRLR